MIPREVPPKVAARARLALAQEWAPYMAHTEECRRSARERVTRIQERYLRQDIARMVEAVREAGAPVDELDLCETLIGNGGVGDWAAMCETALREGLLIMHKETMFRLPPKHTPLSPKEIAMFDAFLKAERLGVIAESGGKLAFTDLREEGLLTPEELDMAEVEMAGCNALKTPYISESHKSLARGEITVDDIMERINKAAGRAEELMQREQTARKAAVARPPEPAPQAAARKARAAA